jgi:glycosyltransferase involved in cell wall biosynthesis
MSGRPVNVFAAERGNAFMTDIARWLVEAAQLCGRPASLHQHGLPCEDGAINLVVAPHELFGLSEASDDDGGAAMSVSVPVCTEQPGTPWFNLTAALVGEAPLVLDINQHGVDALRARGFDAHHLRLGGVPSMVAPQRARDLDLVFLGGSTPRRNARLAALAPLLWNRASELRMFRITAPVDGDVPGVVIGAAKYELLARSRIMLNIHRDDVTPGYFEWARMVEAMANGCAVLTEPCTGFAPLTEGVHFIAGHDLEVELASLLDDAERCRQIGAAARAAVLDEHPLVASLAPLLDRLDQQLGAHRQHRRRRLAGGLPRAHKPPLMREFRPHVQRRREVYAAWMAEMQLARQIDRTRCAVVHGSDDVIERTESTCYGGADPEISVVVTLYDYADLVTHTLDSVVASTGVAIEVVVVDDHSTDSGRGVVQHYMTTHPDVPMLLLGSEVNRGLSLSRNLGVDASRAPLVMVMDADNLVYPTCLSRLRDALRDDPGAAFAYSTLEAFGHDPGLRSELAWHPRWLCEVNYIDAQAMVRRSTFERHGGYRDVDEFTYGWEDWAFWLRLAAAGERGLHIPQMLGRYRTQRSSMVSITNLVADELRARIVAEFPTLPWPEHDRQAGVSTAEGELAARLGAARRKQDYLQRPSGIVTDAADSLAARLRRRVR